MKTRNESIRELHQTAVELEGQVYELVGWVNGVKLLTPERQATLVKASWADAVYLRDTLKQLMADSPASVKPVPTSGREL